MATEQGVLIEQTAKKWKAYQLLGAGVILLGLGILALAIWTQWFAFIRLSAIVPASGILIILTAKTMAWWHHG